MSTDRKGRDTSDANYGRPMTSDEWDAWRAKPVPTDPIAIVAEARTCVAHLNAGHGCIPALDKPLALIVALADALEQERAKAP